MGCDIHAYIEYRTKAQTETGRPDSWASFGGRINPGRDYTVFNRLAGVRGNGKAVIPVRGIPSDLGFYASNDWWLYIVDHETDTEGHVSRETAERWIASYNLPTKLDYQGGVSWVQHPDWHTSSWCTPDEWEKVITGKYDFGVSIEYTVMLAAMRALEEGGFEVRCVFWFDN